MVENVLGQPVMHARIRISITRHTKFEVLRIYLRFTSDGHTNSESAANTFRLMNFKFLSIEFECWCITEDRDGKTIRLSPELSESKSTSLTVRPVCTVSVRVVCGNTEVSFLRL